MWQFYFESARQISSLTTLTVNSVDSSFCKMYIVLSVREATRSVALNDRQNCNGKIVCRQIGDRKWTQTAHVLI